MITETQIETRKTCLGGSDIAAVLGLSRYKTALSVWAEKTGRIEPENISDKLQVKLGIKMEQIVSELFMEETGKKLHRVNETLVHKDYPFLQGHIDRRVVGEQAIVEIKTTSAYNKKDWDNGNAPQEYLIQLMFYMGLTNSSVGYLVGLIGNSDLKIIPVYRDEQVITSIMNKAATFWNKYIATKEMPMTISANDGDTLYKLFPFADPNNDVLLPDDANILIEQIESSNAELNALEDDVERMKNELKAMLGENEHGQTDFYRISWKTQHAKRIDTERLKKEQEVIYSAYLKTSSSRVLRFAKKEKS